MKVKTGWNGSKYLVFETECEAEEYADWLANEYEFYSQVECFGGYCNALVLKWPSFGSKPR